MKLRIKLRRKTILHQVTIPQRLNLSASKTSNTTSSNKTTKYNEMIESMIKWFEDRKGKVTYTMSAARRGPNSYDCSSAVFSSLIASGFVPSGTNLGSTVTLWGMLGASKLMVEIPKNQARRGDIFLSGGKGAGICWSKRPYRSIHSK